MALNSDAVLKVGTGAFYTAEIGTPMPDVEGLLSPADPWEHMGHTSLDDILNSTTEGGERTPLPSLQAPTGVRTTVSASTRTYNINLLQFDPKSLKLFYGSNAEVDEATGRVKIPETPIASELAWLFVFRDGSRVGALHTARASIIGGEDFGISDTESLSRLALAITPMVEDGDDSGSAITFQTPVNVEDLGAGGELGE